MSTRIFVFAIAIAIASPLMPARAAQPSGEDAAAALPAGALKDSASLYLRDAASSPVRWQPWDASSFALARKLNRPVLIDIGAVWCHWCHVMDETTYADSGVAHLLNMSFVPIKVDADERPDIDAHYQDAASRLAGASGWPLTCLTTPDGGLFLAFSYVPVGAKAASGESAGKLQGMVAILKRVAELYRTDRPTLERDARALQAEFASETAGSKGGGNLDALGVEISHSLDQTYDSTNGGFRMGEGARFYDFPAIELALADGFFGAPRFTQIAIDSLKRIAAGGVYDQLGGGFHRYSTDARWRVPHFEKMLYDQAMAIEAYSLAYEESGDEELARVARETIGYVGREMLDPASHTFYSHQDADAFGGDDGSYYTWTTGELARALSPEEARAARRFFGIDDPARAPDGRIVLRRALTRDELAKSLRLARARSDAILDGAIAKMRQARDYRRRPIVDHMILVDRNALAAKAYLVASAALQDETLKRIALDDIDFILAHARLSDGSFYHAYANGKPAVPGLVADQVCMLSAMLAAYQAAGDQRYLDQSRKLANLIVTDYRDATSGLLRNHAPRESGTPDVDVAPSADVMLDRPMPSVQAIASLALGTLAALTGDPAYSKWSEDLLRVAAGRVNPEMATMLGTLGLALDERAHGETVIAIVGPTGAGDGSNALRQAALRAYRPGKVVMLLDSRTTGDSLLPVAARAMFNASKKRAQPLAFVCAGTACANPVSDAPALVKLIREFQVAPRRVARDGGS